MVNKATHEVLNGARSTGLKWDEKNNKVLGINGGWMGISFSRAELERWGYTLKPIYKPMVNK